MKRLLLFLLLIPTMGFGQYPGTWFRASQWMRSPIYFVGSADTAATKAYVRSLKISYPPVGIPLSTGSAWGSSITNNSANWNTAYGWGNHSGLYKGISDSVNLHGFATQYDLTQLTSSQWVTKGDDIYYTIGNVGINLTTPLAKLDVNGSINGTSIQVDGVQKDIIWDSKEPSLGNPATNGYLLTSTTDGVRSWVPNSPSQWISDLGNIKYNRRNVYIGSTVDSTDFPLARFISSSGNSGHTYTGNIGVIGEAIALSGDTGTGVGGVASTNGANQGRGVSGVGKVSLTGDSGASIGGYFRSEDAHTGGLNIGLSCRAVNGNGNYALSFAGGDISSITNSLNWLLYDNQSSPLSFGSTGKSDILKFITTDGSEGISTSGTIYSAGAITSGASGATTSVIGTTQLSNSYVGTSQVLAVTEKALSDGLATITSTSRKLASFYTDAVTSGTSATVLYTYTLPANTLSANGDVIECDYTINDMATDGTITFGFGSYSTYQMLGVDPNTYHLKITLIRSSSSTIRFIYTLQENLYWGVDTITGIDFTVSNVIKLSATANDNTITAMTGMIIKL